MTEENLPILKQFAYRPKPLMILLGFLFLAPMAIWVVWLAYQNPCAPDMSSGDCSLGSYKAHLFYQACMTALGAATFCLPFIALYRRKKSEQDPKGNRVAFTEKYIIGPSQGLWRNKEARVNYSDIKEFDLGTNGQSQNILKVISDNVDLTIMGQMLDDGDLEKIYEEIKLRVESPELASKDPIEVKKVFQDRKVIAEATPFIIVTFVYTFLCFLPAIGLDRFWNKQIDGHSLFGAGFIINLLLLVGLFIVLRRFKKPEKPSQLIGCYVLVGLSFLVGLIGQASNLSFLNQIVCLKMQGSRFELSLLLNEDLKRKFERNRMALSRELEKFYFSVEISGDYLKVIMHAMYFKKKSVGGSLKDQIDKVTKVIERYQRFDISDEQIIFYDELPAPNDPLYFRKLEKERHTLIDNTKGNYGSALFRTLFKNGPFVLIFSIILGLLREYYTFAVLPLEVIILVIIFSSSFAKRCNKIDLRAQLLYAASIVALFFLHFYIKVSVSSWVRKGEITSLDDFLKIVTNNFSEMNRGIFLSIAIMVLFIFGLRRTKRDIKVRMP